MIEGIIDRTTLILEKSMQLRMLRQGLLASNIANAETPNYRAVDIDFKSTMANLIGELEEPKKPLLQLERTHARHFAIDALKAKEIPSRRIVFAAGDSDSVGNDSNSVDLPVQLARLQMNAGAYSTLARLLGRKLAGLKEVIESGARL